MAQLTEEQQEPTIRTGGEDLSIFEVMQRYRHDGSCGHVIEDALRRVALLDSDSQAACKLEFEAKLLGFPNKDDRIKLCERCLLQAIADNFVIFSSSTPREMQRCLHCDPTYQPTGPDDWCNCKYHEGEGGF